MSLHFSPNATGAGYLCFLVGGPNSLWHSRIWLKKSTLHPSPYDNYILWMRKNYKHVIKLQQPFSTYQTEATFSLNKCKVMRMGHSERMPWYKYNVVRNKLRNL